MPPEDVIGPLGLAHRDFLGRLGQSIGEVVTGGRPASFLLELPSRALLRADLFVSETMEVVEVKAGSSAVKEYQLSHYRRGHFKGGLSVLFVQDPFTGRIGPSFRDYLILSKMGVGYMQVWFTGVPWPVNRFATKTLGRRRVTGPNTHNNSSPATINTALDFFTRNRRGLREIVVYLLVSNQMSGTELMDAVELMTRGRWRPTAGSVYPLLRQLLEEGVISRTPDGARFELSAETRRDAQVSADKRPHWPRTTDDMVSQMQGFVSYMEDVKSSDVGGLEPHKSRLREIARRIADLVGEEDPRA